MADEYHAGYEYAGDEYGDAVRKANVAGMAASGTEYRQTGNAYEALAAEYGAMGQQLQAGDRTVAAQIQQLANGVSTRSAEGLPGAAYAQVPHQQLYDWVQQIGPQQNTAIGQDYVDIANTVQDHADQLNNAIARSQQHWVGAAADASHTFVSGMAAWSDHAAQASALAGDQLAVQAHAAQTAKTSMPKPQPFSLPQAMSSLVSDPNPFTFASRVNNIKAQADASNEAHQQAIQTMSEYHGNLAQGSTRLPVYQSPPSLQAPAPTTVPVAGPAATSGQPRNLVRNPPALHRISKQPAAARQSAAKVGPGSTTIATAGYPGSTIRSGVDTAGPAGDQQTAGANTGGVLDGIPIMVGGPGVGGAGADIPRSGSAFGGGGGGAGSSSDATGGGQQNSGQQSGGQAGGDQQGSGAQSGVDAKPEPAVAMGEEATTKPGAAGEPGAPMAGMPGGGRGGKKDDTEHKSKFLVPEDGNKLFGVTERLVPPVIGGPEPRR